MKNNILMAIEHLVIFIGILCACALDSVNWVPFLIGLLACTGYVGLFELVNSDILNRY